MAYVSLFVLSLFDEPSKSPSDNLRQHFFLPARSLFSVSRISSYMSKGCLWIEGRLQELSSVYYKTGLTTKAMNLNLESLGEGI